MRRLSIIDLAGGEQPMLAEGGSVCIVFNGEIYNYVELRDALRARGHEFVTHSDTEVLLRSYLEYGTDCIQHLRGMFAFAIWDRTRQRLFVARDRLGKKPLYYGWRGTDFVFASELKALVGLPGQRPEIDPIALALYFTFQYVPGPRTILEGFQKLQPGCAMTLESERVHVWRYWSPPFRTSQEHSPSLAESLDVLRDTLTEAIALRLRSDVPVGTFLSGGLDSSVITALMVRLSGQRVQTFSVGFSENTGVDESAAARRVARYLGTEHHELRVEGRMVDLLPTVVWHMDEPFADAAALPTFQIARVAREHVKVVLTGEGADELFGGYSYIQVLSYLSVIDRLPKVLRESLAVFADPISSFAPKQLTRRIARMLRLLPSDSLETRYLRRTSIFDEAACQRLLGSSVWQQLADAGGVAGYVGLPSRQNIPGALDWLLAALCQTWLPDDLLMKVDKMTMAVGLEARAPFLDQRLVDAMARVPAHHKLRGATGKYLLRKLAGELLPADIAGRRKHGFDVPTDAWFRGELRELLLDTLESPSFRDAGIVNAREATSLARDHLDGRADHGQRLWTILCFHLWYERFILRVGERAGAMNGSAVCNQQRIASI
jgi:asparagine synthase (glutamine-hydrolysing)